MNDNNNNHDESPPPPVETPADQRAGNPVASDAIFGSVSDRESVRKLLEKDDGQKVDANRLLKHVPKAAQQVKEGNMSPEELASLFSQQSFICDAKKLAKKPTQVFKQVALLGWPKKSIKSQGPTERAEAEMLEEFVSDFRVQTCALGTEAPVVNGKLDWGWLVSNLHHAYKETCQHWATRFDLEYYSGYGGSFLRSNSLYMLSEDDWSAAIFPMLDEDIQRIESAGEKATVIERDTRLAAGAIFECLDESWSHCWECRKKFKELRQCAKCKVAKYCGRSCQVAAWKRGHKISCVGHKYYHDFCLKQIDKANSFYANVYSDGPLWGFYPNERVDYEFVLLAMAVSKVNDLKDPSPFLGPDISIFYLNLTQVSDGVWWIYSNPDTVEDYEAKIASIPGEDPYDVMFDHLWKIFAILSYDIRGLANSGNEVNSEAIEAAIGQDAAVMNVCAKMPVEYFWQKYYVEKHVGDSKSREKLATLGIARTIKKFRETFGH